MPLIAQQEFLRKYNISDDDFRNSSLKWKDLANIYDDYEAKINELESTAQYLTNFLLKARGVHSIRYRIKDKEHLIEKIIRKKIENPGRIITVKNYIEQITDLIGIRAIHLFKEQWQLIHGVITTNWNLKEQPIAYIRQGDNRLYSDKFEEKGCEVKTHPAGYRSLHFVIETQPNKQKFYAEIQVRTIFEEGWSEIDHKIRYPYETENETYNSFLSILNRLAGSADEMGSFIRTLSSQMDEMKHDFESQLKEKDKAIVDLQRKIEKLGIPKKDKLELNSELKNLSQTVQPMSFWDSLGLSSTQHAFLDDNGLIQFTPMQPIQTFKKLAIKKKVAPSPPNKTFKKTNSKK